MHGPRPRAKSTVPIPTEPPNANPIASAAIWIAQLATEMRGPRRTIASIRLSRGPAPKLAPM